MTPALCLAFPDPHHPCIFFSPKLSQDSSSMLWIQGHKAKLRKVVRYLYENRDSMKINTLNSQIPQFPLSFWLQELHVSG